MREEQKEDSWFAGKPTKKWKVAGASEANENCQ